MAKQYWLLPIEIVDIDMGPPDGLMKLAHIKGIMPGTPYGVFYEKTKTCAAVVLDSPPVVTPGARELTREDMAKETICPDIDLLDRRLITTVEHLLTQKKDGNSVNWFQTFDGLNNGALNGQDSFSATAGVTVQDVIKYAGAKAVKGIGAASHYCTRTFAGTNSEDHWVKIALMSTDSGGVFPVIYVGETAVNAALFGAATGYWSGYDGDGVGEGTWLSSGVPVVNDAWMLNKIKMMFPTNSFDLYVGSMTDPPQLSGLGFRHDNLDSLNWLRVTTNNVTNSGGRYFDEFEIRPFDMDAGGMDLLSNSLENNPLMGGGLLH